MFSEKHGNILHGILLIALFSCAAFYLADTQPARSLSFSPLILGILLGGLGIHKFYLGYTTAGIIMLVVSIVSCGFVAPIISIIGLIEGILYLTKSDEEFYRTYIAGQRPWF